MTDYTVRELMDKALDGLRPPTEDITEAVLTQATRVQRRRRAGALVATSAGLALAAGAVALLPHAATGASGTAGHKAGAPTVTAAPAAPGNASAKASAKAAVDPAALVASLLPPGSGTVTKLKDLPPTPPPPGMTVKTYAQSRFDGTYVITKDGKAATLVIHSYDPKARPAQYQYGPMTAQACQESPASWQCAFSQLPGGATLLEMTEGPGGYSAHSGIVNTADVSYPDGRMFSVVATSSAYGSQQPGVAYETPLGHPVADRAQLAAFAESAAWFS